MLESKCTLLEALVGNSKVDVYQLVENLGCVLCYKHLSACMWVPFPFHMTLLVTLVVFRNTQCPGTAEGRMEKMMG